MPVPGPALPPVRHARLLRGGLLSAGSAPKRGLGFGSGLGLVVANMIGSGVFLSAGFMAQQLGPGAILLAWVLGTLIALCGARAYAEIAQLVPRSGGEYRYLSELMHPVLGTLAGWASLLLGFSAPIAVAGLAAGHFTRTLAPGVSPYLVATALIVLLTAAHAGGFHVSRRTQDGLVLVKAALLVGFVLVGIAHAPLAWPAWTPPSAPPPGALASVFITSLFFVAFAFSGWNAAAYAASEFEHPRRDVPRAMMLGCALVGALYLAVNWVFVSSIPPDRASVVLDESRRVTLGHLVMQDALGPVGGAAMSVLTIIAFVSSMSAMTFVGPRVYAAMARDGHLPALFAARDEAPPAASVILQGALALVLVFTQRLQQVLMKEGGVLTLFTALVALSLFRVRWTRRPPDAPAPGAVSLAAAGLYVIASAVMLYYGFRSRTRLLLWVLAVMVAAGAFQAWRSWSARKR